MDQPERGVHFADCEASIVFVCRRHQTNQELNLGHELKVLQVKLDELVPHWILLI